MKKISSIHQNISNKDAERIIERVSGDYIPQVQKKIYYPYYWFLMEYTTKHFILKRNIQASCFVDLRNKIASTTDKFHWEEIEVSEENVMEGQIGEQEALKIARSYLVHSAVHNMKSLIFPNFTLVQKMQMFKPYWIVRCQRSDLFEFKVIVDGATGRFKILDQ